MTLPFNHSKRRSEWSWATVISFCFNADMLASVVAQGGRSSAMMAILIQTRRIVCCHLLEINVSFFSEMCTRNVMNARIYRGHRTSSTIELMEYIGVTEAVWINNDMFWSRRQGICELNACGRYIVR